MDRRVAGGAALAVYAAAIPAANWLIRSAGTVVLPDGTHLAPVGFGLLAPSGVYAAGVSFVARDVVQRALGRGPALAAILLGTALSAGVSPQLALASGSAFLVSELADFAVYTPLQRRRFVLAVLASGWWGAWWTAWSSWAWPGSRWPPRSPAWWWGSSGSSSPRSPWPPGCGAVCLPRKGSRDDTGALARRGGPALVDDPLPVSLRSHAYSGVQRLSRSLASRHPRRRRRFEPPACRRALACHR